MRRFNQESSNVLPVLLIAGAAGYFWWYSNKHKKSIAQSVTEHIPERVPHPEYAMVIPKTQDELDTIDEALCACYDENKAALGEEPPLELAVTTLQICTAKSLYSDFPWPPMAGDHESVAKLWGILEYRIRQLINDDELDSLCMKIPVPMPGEGPEGAGAPGEGEGEGEAGAAGEGGEAEQAGLGQAEPEQAGLGQAEPEQAGLGQAQPGWQPQPPPGGFAQPPQGGQVAPGQFGVAPPGPVQPASPYGYTTLYTPPKPPKTLKFNRNK